MRSQDQHWEEISIEYDGKIINGSYKAVRNTVIVRSVRATKVAPLSGPTPESLAKMLLRELAREGRA